MLFRFQALSAGSRILLFSVAVGAAWGQSAPSPALPVLQGQAVVAVRVVSDTGEVLEDNPADLPLRSGQPFAIDSERQSLRQLFRSGEYADVETQAATVAGGLRVDFVVRRNFYVNQVLVVGVQEPPSETVAVSALRFDFGAIFRESDMPAAIARLQQTLQDEGFYQAKLTYALTPHEQTRQMDITVNVEPGPRAVIGAVSITDETPFPEAQLRGRLKVKPGAKVTSQRLANDTERMRKWLVSRNYLGARISLERGAYQPKTNAVPLHISLYAALAVHVNIEGDKLSSGTLHRLLPIYQEGTVDEDLLQEGRRNLRDYLQSEGYFDADVTYTTSSSPANPSGAAPAAAAPTGSQTITYSVERGTRHRLVGFTFTGNHYFDEELLRSRLQIQAAGITFRGRFNSELVAADVASIAALYQSNGFLQVRVTDDVDQNYRGSHESLFVRFHIEEGLQTRIATLKIDGNQALSTDTLTAVIGSNPGQPFSDFNVAGDRDNILALYYDKGFPDARFQATTIEAADPAGEGPRVELSYHIDEGSQVHISRLLVSGSDHTHPDVIEREIQLHEGQPLSEGAAVESQRRLYNLGIFSRVSIAPQNPTGTDPDKTVGVLVEEARRYSIGYGLGIEAERIGVPSEGPTATTIAFSPRGTLELAKLNLTGRADTLSLKVRFSTLQGRGLLTYISPNYWGHPSLSMQLSGFYEKTRDISTFTSVRTEGSAQLTDRLSQGTSLLFRYAYRHVLASDLQISPEEIPLYSQPTRASLVGVTWLRDRRNSPADPSRGTFNTVDYSVALRGLGSSASFSRAFVQNSTYTPIGRRLVFARSFRLGVETPLGQTNSADIPLPERFFAGGGTTLRGFELNEAGPRDPLTGFPIGGLGMMVFNQQLQFPMRLPYVGNRLGGALFYDAGNVFSTFRQISFRLAPPKPIFDPAQPGLCVLNCTNSLSYLSHTVGFEFRYRTPVGPVSIDLAYQLNPALFLEPDGGTLPGGAPGLMTARLPAFQFFVNLGPSF
jgi:outer membrane protein insertion porin family